MASQPRRVLPRERDVLRATMVMVSKVASPVIMTSSHAPRPATLHISLQTHKAAEQLRATPPK